MTYTPRILRTLAAAALAFGFAGMTPALAQDAGSGPLLVTFALDAKDKTGADLRAFFDEILPGTRGYSGNVSARYLGSVDEADKLLLLEEWSSRADFDAYLAWRMERGDFAKLMSLLDSEPALGFFQQ
ncbi:antibiotic biosynthesis monooxygenase [Ruegeria pomeroyi]|uniref:putative quinol monooxygenase n=1 Tax=Ruegeria pomeroyi TaxID=89184 RepID=UPI001F34A1C6|nr:antibiotic biosynthesis monooxygenase family protein [Ruegeria pomeroyi]MCE8510950.1 antibiotic biosynthesis monooxygenase [Ruegeria pomeroyi]